MCFKKIAKLGIGYFKYDESSDILVTISHRVQIQRCCIRILSCIWSYRPRGIQETKVQLIRFIILYYNYTQYAGPHVVLKIIVIKNKKLYNIYWSLLCRCRWVNQFAGAWIFLNRELYKEELLQHCVIHPFIALAKIKIHRPLPDTNRMHVRGEYPGVGTYHYFHDVVKWKTHATSSH